MRGEYGARAPKRSLLIRRLLSYALAYRRGSPKREPVVSPTKPERQRIRPCLSITLCIRARVYAGIPVQHVRQARPRS